MTAGSLVFTMVFQFSSKRCATFTASVQTANDAEKKRRKDEEGNENDDRALSLGRDEKRERRKKRKRERAQFRRQKVHRKRNGNSEVQGGRKEVE